MTWFITSVLTHLLLVAVLSWSLVFTPLAMAQQEMDTEISSVSPQPPVPNAGQPVFTQ